MKKEALIILLVVLLVTIVSADDVILYEGKEYCDIKVLAITPSEVSFQIDSTIREIKEGEEKNFKDYEIHVKNIFYSGKASVVNWATVVISPELPSRCFRELTEEEKAIGFEDNYTICPNTKKSDYTVKVKPEIVEEYYCPEMPLPADKIIIKNNLKEAGLNFLKENFSEFPDLDYIECVDSERQPESHKLFEKITNNESEKYYREAWICKDAEWYYVFEHKNKKDKLYGPFGDYGEKTLSEKIKETTAGKEAGRIGNWFERLIEKIKSWFS